MRVLAAALLIGAVAVACSGSGGSGSGGAYVALGDSLSEGSGASDPATTAFVPLVHQALGDGFELINYGHAGDTSAEMFDHGHFDDAIEEIERRSLDGDDGNDVRLITLEIGGNDLLDIYFDLVVPGDCPSVIEALQREVCVNALNDALAGYRVNLAETLRRLIEAAPGTPIFLMTLYNPFSGLIDTYAALGEPRWKGRLCLRTSSHVYNQSLLATMIKRQGEARVEATVRNWVANQPVLINSDTKILEAIAAGQCDVGITNTYYLGRLLAKDPAFPVAPFWANQATTGTHVNISGAGVTAHAKNRAAAIKLLEFLSSPEAQQMFADSNFEYPANPQAAVSPVVARWGKFRQDDVNVAAAGEFQAAAVRLADRAGYK